MTFTTRDYLFCGLSIALGAINGYKLNDVSGDWIQIMSEACESNIKGGSSSVVLQPYLQWGIFDSFVCCITQMFYDLATQNPGGRLVLISTFLTYMPVLVLMGHEAGRPTAKAFIKYPMIVALMAQFIGVSVAFPLFWVPSYVASRAGSSERGLLSTRRIVLSLLPPLAYLIFFILVLFVPTTTYLWTFSAGIAGGPVIVLIFAPLWIFSNDADANTPSNKKSQSSQLITLPYAACGVICFFIWLWLLALVLLPQLGINPTAIYQEIWGNAGTAVKFLALDALVLWLSAILVVAYEKNSAALEVLGATCLFGPGTAVSLVLAGLQVDDDDSLWDNTATTSPPSDKTKAS